MAEQAGKEMSSAAVSDEIGPSEATLPAMVLARCQQYGPRLMLANRRADGSWQKASYAEIEAEIRLIAAGLLARGISAGDRVMIIAENRMEWVITDLAVMAIGGITVPVYTTSTIDDTRYLIEDSGAVAIICSTQQLAQQAAAAASQSFKAGASQPAAAACRLLVIMDAENRQSHQALQQAVGLAIISWQQLRADGEATPLALEPVVATLKADDVCCLIYTSGTGGRPKGVMLTHRSIMANIRGAEILIRDLGLGREVFLSLLPLSHAYEHTAGLFLPIHIGAEIHQLTAPDQLSQALRDIQPTFMTAVPRLYEVLYDRINNTVNARGGLSRKLFQLAVSIGSKSLRGEARGPTDIMLDPLLGLLVRRRIAAQFGGRLKAFVSGGAALQPQIGMFFLALGIRLLQGYGQTEASPVISANPPRAIKIATVGPPLDGVTVKLAEDGELLVRGPMVMKGYWNQPETTAEVLRDGWLHTGDLAAIDSDGYITITGRKKDIIVNSGGENISPGRVEARLMAQPAIAQAMVDGDRKPWLAAVIVASETAKAEAGGDRQKLEALIQEGLNTANARLAIAERVRRFIIAEQPFTTENALLTPTLKIRRHQVRAAYAEDLEALYKR